MSQKPVDNKEKQNIEMGVGKNVPFKDSIKVDYLIALAYFVVVAMLFWILYTRNDFMVQYVLPFGLIAIVTFVFANYLHKVLKAPKK